MTMTDELLPKSTKNRLMTVEEKNVAVIVGNNYDPRTPPRPSPEELRAFRRMLSRGENPFVRDIDRVCFWLMAYIH